MTRRTKLGRSMDWHRRSKQPWERGQGAPKKGNPSYTPVRVRRRDGVMTTVYKRRR